MKDRSWSNQFVAELTYDDFGSYRGAVRSMAESQKISETQILNTDGVEGLLEEVLRWKPQRVWLAMFVDKVMSLLIDAGWKADFKDLLFSRWCIMSNERGIMIKTDFARIQQDPEHKRVPSVGKVMSLRHHYLVSQRLICRLLDVNKAFKNIKGAPNVTA